MSDFIFWNIIFLISCCLFNVIRWSLPSGVVFSVVSLRKTLPKGRRAVVLINEDRVLVFCTGRLWRYTKDGKVLPEEWGEIIDNHES